MPSSQIYQFPFVFVCSSKGPFIWYLGGGGHGFFLSCRFFICIFLGEKFFFLFFLKVFFFFSIIIWYFFFFVLFFFFDVHWSTDRKKCYKRENIDFNGGVLWYWSRATLTQGLGMQGHMLPLSLVAFSWLLTPHFCFSMMNNDGW